MPNFPGSEQWMIGSGYELLVISSIGGPNLNELSAPIHNSRPDPIPVGAGIGPGARPASA